MLELGNYEGRWLVDYVEKGEYKEKDRYEDKHHVGPSAKEFAVEA